MKHRPWQIALLFGAALLLTSCSAGGDSDEILIGEFASLTGSEATFGQATHNGIILATEQANAAGGVLGRQVRIIVEDDQGLPEQAQTVVTKLITSDQEVAVLGEVASSRTRAAAPVAQQYGIPLNTPSSTNVEITRIGDYIFRICFIDPFQGLVMARFAANTLGIRNVAILRDIGSDYSVGLADAFIENFTGLGGTIAGDQSYSPGGTDFSAQLTSLAASNPDAIFIPGYYTDVGLIARQARQLGLTIPLLGGDGWDSPRLAEIGGEAIEGSYFSNHSSMQDPSPAIQQFVADYQTRHGEAPSALAALGYDAANILFEAMRRAGTTNGEAVRDAIAQTRDFPGVTGTITIDTERNASKPAVVLQVMGGQFQYVETISP
jgi:branched-chain amino acid transport system substrate-binding protein